MKRIIAIVVLSVLATLSAFAADGDPAPQVSPIGLPQLIISVLTPVVVWLVTLVVPKIPRNLLPVIAPVVGVAIDYVVSYVTNSGFSWIDGAAAGAIGVWVRELVNQQITKRFAAEPVPPS